MHQPFNYYKKTEKNSSLILFVHGFTGSHETWLNSRKTSFAELLLLDNEIKSNFDIASYEYYTKLFGTFAKAESVYGRLTGLLTGKRGKNKRNLEISELANNLRDELRFSAKEYEHIIIVAHSMGGLITKSLIIDDLKNFGETKVKLFVSLAVPHLGADIATLGKLISSNLQIENLNSVSEFLVSLNEAWIKTDNKPITKYFYGGFDNIVARTSAKAIEKGDKDVVSVTHDHNSITRPEGKDDVVVSATVKFIKDIQSNIDIDSAGYQKLDDVGQFDEELFVLKMILGDIASGTQKNVKELFLNAEYSRKILKSKFQKNKLEELFENINQLYRDSYDKYLHDNKMNSGALLVDVHEKITEEDNRLLKSMATSLKVFHKKGMLHQLANSKEYDIWWGAQRIQD